MSWFKVDDQLAFHAKTLTAGNEAMGLWVRAASWSCAHLTDGFIPEAVADSMANRDFAMRLLMANLWEETEGGYQFHDWFDFQPSGKVELEKRERIRKQRSSAGKKGAASRWGDSKTPNLPSQTDSKPIANAMANAKQTDSPVPVPLDITNVISRGSKQPSESSRKKPSTTLPDEWKPNENHRKKALEQGFDIEEQADRFRNHALARDLRYANWNAAFNNWISRVKDFQPQSRTQSGSGFSVARNPAQEALDIARRFHELENQPPTLEIPQ